jgi:hypothetical protein
VKSAVDQGRKLEGLAQSIQLPEAATHWVGDSFANQVRDVYEEITQGKPRGDLPQK